MSDHQHDHDEEQEPRRPRVVDKRISARDAGESAAPEREPTPPSGDDAGETFRPPSASPPPQEEARPEREDPSRPGAPGGAGGAGEQVWTPEQEAEAQRIVQEIDRVPARDWVVSAAMNLVNVAGVKLDRGDLPGAQLAIDALSGMLRDTATRLGDAEEALKQVLAQLQMAYAQAVQSPGNTPG